MSAYRIDFSDPLKASFSIPDGGFNGPGGSSANTTLRLYGRGAREWGEAVDEDLVRLVENFSSASAPSVPIGGQFWIETSLYYRDTTLGSVLQGWYFYDLTSSSANKWTLLGGTGVVSGTAPLSPTEGQYYYDGTANQLMGYFSLGRYEPLTFVVRSSTFGAGAPVSPAYTPLIQFRVWNAGTSQWITPSTTSVSSGTPPSGVPIGSLWFNTTTGNLMVWTGTQWQQLLGPTVPGGQSATSGTLNMNTFKIINMGAPTNPNDAATKAYVDGVVGGVGGFLPLTGGTLSGPGNLTVSGAFVASGTGSVATLTAGTLHLTGNAQLDASLTVNNGLTVSNGVSIATGQLNMNGSKIVNLQAGTGALDAVNVAQMNAAVAAGSVGSNVPLIYGGSGTYKAGDIAIFGGKIYIAIGGGSGNPPGGNWKQVWPATYS